MATSCDNAVVVVDSLTKRAHFLMVNTTITAEGSVRQFRDNVWKLHGLPTCTISDCGPQFTAEVYRLLGIKAAKTTAYHPQADGQTVSHLECLPTPDICWDTISVDFIVELPESDGYDVVMVVVDSLCKRAHFLPVNTTITAMPGSAQQFRDNVWKHHGLPTCILSSDWHG
jgi:hypothetical protein